MATPSPDSTAGTPAPDVSTMTRFWSDMLQATSTFWLSQSGRWSRALDQMRSGAYDSSLLMKDMAGTLDEWTVLAATPCQGVSHSERQLPTLLFVVDGDTE